MPQAARADAGPGSGAPAPAEPGHAPLPSPRLPSPADNGNAYERERDARIAANRLKLAALNLAAPAGRARPVQRSTFVPRLPGEAPPRRRAAVRGGRELGRWES